MVVEQAILASHQLISISSVSAGVEGDQSYCNYNSRGDSRANLLVDPCDGIDQKCEEDSAEHVVEQ